MYQYNLGNYGDQLGLDRQQLGAAYQAAGGNPYDVIPPQQQAPAAQQRTGGLSTLEDVQNMSDPSGGGSASKKADGGGGLDKALGIVGKILAFL